MSVWQKIKRAAGMGKRRRVKRQRQDKKRRKDRRTRKAR
jgi:hypothetical protein